MIWLPAHLMLQFHLAMSYQQSLVAIAQSGSHILANIPPHVLKHPKTFAHNLQSCLHRSGPHNLAKNSPHASKYSRCSFTIFKHVHTKCSHNLASNLPHKLKYPKTFQPNLQPYLHRSGLYGLAPSSPHAKETSRDVISAIFDCNCTTWVTHSGENYPSCVETSEDVFLTIFDYTYTEVVHITWEKNHLMLQSTRGARRQSSNMLTLSDFTI
jgi:hypothetical protein